MFGPQARKGFSRSVLSSLASSWIRPHGQPVAIRRSALLRMDEREGNRTIDDVRRHVSDMTKITTLAGYGGKD
jgi:hypothetical protein